MWAATPSPRPGSSLWSLALVIVQFMSLALSIIIELSISFCRAAPTDQLSALFDSWVQWIEWMWECKYGHISFTLFVVRTLEYVLQISRGPGTGIQCVTTTSYSPTAGLWLLNASGFLWGQGPGKGGTGGDRLVPWRNYLLEIDIDTLLVLVGSSGNTEIRSIAFRHKLHLYLYMYVYIYIYNIHTMKWNNTKSTNV